MILLNDYSIEKISENCATSVHRLMISNAERFKRYFPKTLELNLTVELSQLFVAKKNVEFINNEEFLFTIKENKTKNVVGLVYIKELDWKKKQGEFAYCISFGHEGKGLISKAVEKLSNYAFVNLRLEVLQIIVHKDNFASVKVAEKSNFSWQRTLLKEYTPPNEFPLDMELYELYYEK
jgi:ribosomal-protein-alanine N-acetyltransferase